MLDNYLNKITCGDSYELIKEIPDKSIDLIYTDPPYEISVNHGAGQFGIKKKLHYKQFSSISHGIDYTIIDEFIRVLKKINLYIWCSKNQIYFVMEKILGQFPACYYEILTWHKTNSCPTCNNKYMPDTEYCLFFREQGVRIYGNVKTKSKYFISSINKSDKEVFNHPTIKPLSFVKNHIQNSTDINDVVLDPFCGSGTTCVAAKELNRRYIGIEINPKWAKITENRLNGIDAHGQIGMFLR